MSDMVKYDKSMTKTVGSELVKFGAAGVGIWTLAAFLPFIGMFGVVLLCIIGGSVMWFTG